MKRQQLTKITLKLRAFRGSVERYFIATNFACMFAGLFDAARMCNDDIPAIWLTCCRPFCFCAAKPMGVFLGSLPVASGGGCAVLAGGWMLVLAVGWGAVDLGGGALCAFIFFVSKLEAWGFNIWRLRLQISRIEAWGLKTWGLRLHNLTVEGWGFKTWGLRLQNLRLEASNFEDCGLRLQSLRLEASKFEGWGLRPQNLMLETSNFEQLRLQIWRIEAWGFKTWGLRLQNLTVEASNFEDWGLRLQNLRLEASKFDGWRLRNGFHSFCAAAYLLKPTSSIFLKELKKEIAPSLLVTHAASLGSEDQPPRSTRWLMQAIQG